MPFSSTYLNDMAGGDMCIAMAWSGDAGIIRNRAQQSHQDFELRYVTPEGQTGLWFSLMAIPKDAPNKDNAYKWINRMLDAKTAADTTNAITYPMVYRLHEARETRPGFRSNHLPLAINGYFVFIRLIRQ